MTDRTLSGHVLAVALVLCLLLGAVLLGQLRRELLLNEAMADHVSALLRGCPTREP